MPITHSNFVTRTRTSKSKQERTNVIMTLMKTRTQNISAKLYNKMGKTVALWSKKMIIMIIKSLLSIAMIWKAKVNLGVKKMEISIIKKTVNHSQKIVILKRKIPMDKTNRAKTAFMYTHNFSLF